MSTRSTCSKSYDTNLLLFLTFCDHPLYLSFSAFLTLFLYLSLALSVSLSISSSFLSRFLSLSLSVSLTRYLLYNPYNFFHTGTKKSYEMLKYCISETCRRVALARYFGEHFEPKQCNSKLQHVTCAQ